ncbi:MAG: hypothetical protein QOH41_3591 [Blastocatellia bacterium]|jgi:hypothetical protein|nr:hypothetical protein [Blastocatellia bacterium]
MRKQLLQNEERERQGEPIGQKKYPRHPITMENTPEETIKRMRAFPERAAKLRELIRALREADTR